LIVGGDKFNTHEALKRKHVSGQPASPMKLKQID
jgi:hypothetical protein